MKAGIFGRPSQGVFGLVARGIDALGYQPIFQRPSVWSEHQAQEFDLVVTTGARLHSAQIRDLYRERGVPVIILDLSPIRRDGLWALWPYKLNTVPIEADRDRLSLVHWGQREIGVDVLICGQVAGDAAHGMDREQIRSWFGRTAELVREKLPSHRVIWRPHPQYPFEMPGFDYSDPRKVSFEDALDGVGAVVTFNSTAGLFSISQGIPTFVSHTCFYKEAASGTGLPSMKGSDALPPRDTIEDYFSRLTHCVWAEDELATAEPYRETLARMEVK